MSSKVPMILLLLVALVAAASASADAAVNSNAYSKVVLNNPEIKTTNNHRKLLVGGPVAAMKVAPPAVSAAISSISSSKDAPVLRYAAPGSDRKLLRAQVASMIPSKISTATLGSKDAYVVGHGGERNLLRVESVISSQPITNVGAVVKASTGIAASTDNFKTALP